MVETILSNRYTTDQPYEGGVGSLIGDSAGISLDGQSIQLPEDTGFVDVQDDISSINESSYYRGVGGMGGQIKVVGTVENTMEEGNADQMSPVSSSEKNMGHHGQEQVATSTAIPLEVGDTKKKPPNMNNTNKISSKGKSSKRGGCLPKWVSAAPRWLKCVIVFSTAMLIGAVVLVTVALSTALASQEESSVTPVTRGAIPGTPPYLPVVPAPTIPSPTAPPPQPTTALPAKRPSPSSTDAPTSAPVSLPYVEPDDETTLEPNVEPDDETTLEPTSAPGEVVHVQVTLAGTQPPVETPAEMEPPLENPAETEPPLETTAEPETQDRSTPAPSTNQQEDSVSAPYDSFVTTFFVTGGRFTNEALDKVPDQLRTLPVRGGTSFLVHLGDWNSPYATRCNEQSYRDVNALFSNSTIPVYFIPGDNDFNDCPEPVEAMSFWEQYLLGYETQHWNAPAQWNVSRADSAGYPENFAFVYNEILFVGINLVGGVVHDSNEWATRQAADLQWIDDNYQQHKDSIRAFVLFAHADPDVPSNSPFYEPFKERVKTEYNQIPVVLIHRNLGVEPWSWETEYENIANFSVIVVAGSSWPPLMGAVDFRQENPFIFDQSSWYDEYLEHQTGPGRV